MLTNFFVDLPKVLCSGMECCRPTSQGKNQAQFHSDSALLLDHESWKPTDGPARSAEYGLQGIETIDVFMNDKILKEPETDEEADTEGFRSSQPMAAPGTDSDRSGRDYDVAQDAKKQVPAISELSRDRQEREGEASGYFERGSKELALIRLNGGVSDWCPYKFADGSTYNGQWKDNMRHGFGKQTWADGATYEGEWTENSAAGNGRFMHIDGDVYIGQWINNTASGLGTYYHNNTQTSYHGQWECDLQHGFGIEVGGEGSKYEGLFRYGSKHGSGRYTFPDSSYCEGDWLENKVDGRARYKSRDQRCFEGQWQNAMLHGIGKYSYPDGMEYRGTYQQDNKHGFGIFIWPNDRCYQGYWCDGKQSGLGWYTQKDGSVIKGLWASGKFVREVDTDIALVHYSSTVRTSASMG